jgi:drug/metabolite transporter, DME family
MATVAPGAGARADAGYLFGVAMVALAGGFWSIGGILVRWIEAADAWQIIFYRSASLALSLTLIVTIRHRGRLGAAFAAAGWNGVLAGAGLSGGFIGYVLALHHTTVANAVFMLGTAPFFAAILGRWCLSEEVRPATWLAMALALAGIAVMVAGSLVLGTISGNLLAMVASLSFAVFNVLLRRGRDTDMLPCVVIAGVIATLIALPVLLGTHADLASALALSGRDLVLCVVMGAVQVGLGLTVFTLGARYVSAVELALLAMTELLLAPLWVWIGIGEVPSGWTLAGGAVVMAAITFQALSGARRRRPPPMV